MKKIIAISLIFTFIFSCAPKPVVVDVMEQKDVYLSCDQLSSAIKSAERYKVAARAEDRFRFRYIFPPTGFIAMYRFIRAESAAAKRIKYLESLASKRRCGTPQQVNVKPKVVNPQMLNYPRKNNPNSNYNYYQYNGQPQYAPTQQGQQQRQQAPNQYAPNNAYNGQPQYAPPQQQMKQPQGQYYPNQYAPNNQYYRQPQYAPPQKAQPNQYYQGQPAPNQYQKQYEEYNLP